MKNSLFVLLLLSFLVGGNGLAGGKDFVGKDLPNGDFTNQSLNKADFTDANLRNAQFVGASLKNAKFKDAIIWGANFDKADLTGADMSGTKISSCGDGVNYSKTNWEGSELRSGRHLNFQGANLKKTKITWSFNTCDFRDADFRGANLRGATFAKGSVANRWKGALYDEDTAFPDGFDPKVEGMILRKLDEKKDDKK